MRFRCLCESSLKAASIINTFPPLFFISLPCTHFIRTTFKAQKRKKKMRHKKITTTSKHCCLHFTKKERWDEFLFTMLIVVCSFFFCGLFIVCSFFSNPIQDLYRVRCFYLHSKACSFSSVRTVKWNQNDVKLLLMATTIKPHITTQF